MLSDNQIKDMFDVMVDQKYYLFMQTMLQLLRTLLNKQLKKGKITPEQSKELLENIQNGVDHVIKSCQQEKDEEEVVSMTVMSFLVCLK